MPRCTPTWTPSVLMLLHSDDLLPEKGRTPEAHGRRRDRHLPWPSSHGIPSDRGFCGGPTSDRPSVPPAFPLNMPTTSAGSAADAIEWLFGIFCTKSPAADDDLLLLDSTPLSVDVRWRRSDVRPGDVCGYGWSSSHSRFFGMQAPSSVAPDGIPGSAAGSGGSTGRRCLAFWPGSSGGRPSSVIRGILAGSCRRARELGGTISDRHEPMKRQRAAYRPYPPADRVGLLDCKICSPWTHGREPAQLAVRITVRLLPLPSASVSTMNLAVPPGDR